MDCKQAHRHTDWLTDEHRKVKIPHMSEGGGHLRISFLHLFMNLKNKYY